jgi:polysaccharide pyruvyl transferase WcaK-like protein
LRILIDGLEHSLTNMGDVAMLQTAIARLRELWPTATIDAIMDAPERLARYCPGVHPIPLRGYWHWREMRRTAAGSVPFAQPRRFSEALRLATRPAFDHMRRALRVARRRERDELDAFVESLQAAQLFVVTGGGGVTDVFKGWALDLLDRVWLASSRGIPTAMVSQGFGPIEDPQLSATARHVLPHVSLIGIREERTGRELLRNLDVPLDRVLTTGDDAVEAAFKFRRSGGVARGIGVNMRVASYSGIEPAQMSDVRAALHDAAAKYGAKLVPLPISFQAGESDAASIARLLAACDDIHRVETLDEPEKVMAEVARCRLVVTGSYHPAVFALSQGIPVVALARSRYYWNKFVGLADQFGAGIATLPMDASALRDPITRAIAAAWEAADDVREALLSAATRQIGCSRECYTRLYELATRESVNRSR